MDGEAQTQGISSQTGTNGGLKIQRKFTSEGVDVFSQFEYELRSSTIRNPDGSVVFSLTNIEVPKNWSQVATDILAQKYFRKAGVPQKDAEGNPIIDKQTGKAVLGSETSVKQIVKRLAGTWRYWGERYNYFSSQEDAEKFEGELIFMLLAQIAAPNSPQWFNNGLARSYDIRGTSQGHYFVDPQTKKLSQCEDAYTHPQLHACFIQSLKDDLVNEGGIFDLLRREALLFKYGSGTGTNFSALRGSGEALSGGGKSSGLMSFLKIYDRAAGAIKSGGTTRRAAKMVIVDADHPDILEFTEWKAKEEQKVASLVSGSAAIKKSLNKILKTAKDEHTTDFKASKRLRQAIASAMARNVPLNLVTRTLRLADQGYAAIDFPIFDTHYEGDAYATVSGQNSNNTVRIPNKFMDALARDGGWDLVNRTDGQISKTIKAAELWDRIAYAAWACADPGLQFDDTINEWHTCPIDGRIHASNPCSEYMFLDDTACNLASFNLAKFLDEGKGEFKTDEYLHAIRLWTIVLEVSVLMAGYPAKEIAKRSFEFRTLGLGYANLGTLLMVLGIPYDSPQALAIAGALSSILTGQAYATSAEMAKVLEPFDAYERNKHSMLRVIRNHRRAAYCAPDAEYEGLSIKPMGLEAKFTPENLLSSARECWDRALSWGEKWGYRNAQATVIAPTGTIGLLMDCDTTGIEPDFAIVKFKKLAGGGYFKIVNQSVKKALKRLGYAPSQIEDIEKFAKGTGTLVGCPKINRESLKEKGFSDEKVEIVEMQMPGVFDIKFAFNRYVLGDEFLRMLGVSDADLANQQFDLLKFLGFGADDIEKANDYVCGTMSLEGAPHLKNEHYPIFDCASKAGRKGVRSIPYQAHIKMMAVVQPFISGSISKTINMPSNSTVQDVMRAYELSHKYMIKANAIYRDGSKLSQPLSSASGVEEEAAELMLLAKEAEKAFDFEAFQPQVISMLQRRKLPSRRRGFVQEARVGGQKVYLKTGEYPDGKLGEIFIDMYKEGASYRALLNCFAVAVSKGLQYGIPLEEFVETFTYTRFEPAGPVSGHEAIKNSTSVVDFLFRALGFEYLGRTDFVHIKPETKDDSVQEKLNQADGEADENSARAEAQKQARLTDTSHQPQPPKPASPEGDKISQAKAMGYTGEQCGTCGSMKMKRNGSCMVCIDCGETTGCS
ncbi:ribonucleoside-diphosphate reductase, adenosylcobalamin-dependent [Candidatus Micrarchaeota archaeon CG10_big_fil_rev_8_21_14_0_10_45_29]|nr:MAG: ribonucleoside-diphosphate reductase, adenosylcobalamin-dependent [Candidatus Micrarchaeota archaeon CG10_big_fil_rev_8_21_14_0_10_45_29]